MRFKHFMYESVFYHGTTEANAALILKNGFDPSLYRSGMFQGVYLAPSLSYFATPDPKRPAILAVDVDQSKLLDVKSITDDDMREMDPHFKMMSYGYKNSLITRIAKERRMGGINNGHEVIVFDPSIVRSVHPVERHPSSAEHG